MPNSISIVTPIRNRFEHLKLTIGNWLENPIIEEIIIVDFGSDTAITPSKFGHHNKIKIIRCGETEPWKKGLAQNVGIQIANSDFILKLDSDVTINNINKYATALSDEIYFSGYIPTDELGNVRDWSKSGCFGQVLFSKRRWAQIGGYHEYFIGWGFDDSDFYNRLEDVGLEHRFFKLDDLLDLPHDDILRGATLINDRLKLPLPANLKSDRWFQNNRNRVLAGLVPWNKNLRRPLEYTKLYEGYYECQIAPESVSELSLQECAAYLAAQRWHSIEPEAIDFFYNRLIDDRLSTYTKRAERDTLRQQA